jgi:hypothetical protein
MSERPTSLPTGTWQIYGTEEQGQLVISSVDNQGKLTGTAFGDNITGSFHAASGVIHFARTIDPSLHKHRIYSGHISIVISGEPTQYLLAGSYHTMPYSLGPRFGWYATAIRGGPTQK